VYGWRSDVLTEANVNSFGNALLNKNYKYPEMAYGISGKSVV